MRRRSHAYDAHSIAVNTALLDDPRLIQAAGVAGWLDS
jgi:hypothetical protein